MKILRYFRVFRKLPRESRAIICESRAIPAQFMNLNSLYLSNPYWIRSFFNSLKVYLLKLCNGCYFSSFLKFEKHEKLGVLDKKSTISNLARTCLILCIYMLEHTKQHKLMEIIKNSHSLRLFV